MSTIDIPGGYVRRMVELESKGNGDQLNALDRVARRIGLKARAARRIMNGERQDIGLTLFDRIHGAYLDLCESQIRKLENEIAIERAACGDHDDLENLADEALALRNKIQKAKGKAK